MLSIKKRLGLKLTAISFLSDAITESYRHFVALFVSVSWRSETTAMFLFKGRRRCGLTRVHDNMVVNKELRRNTSFVIFIYRTPKEIV